MINEFFIYGFCYIMGWLPLALFYQKIEAWFPLPIKKSTTTFSFLPLVYLLYMGLEIYRGYFLMHVVHYWLVDDIGLIIGLLIWLLGIGFPVLVPTSYRTPVWLSILGVYWYLFPMVFWVIPMVLMGLFFIRVSRWQSHGLVGVLFIVIGWAQGGIVCICWYMLGYFYIC